MNRTILMVTVIAAAVMATQPNPHAAASRRRARPQGRLSPPYSVILPDERVTF
jgi:hypothetical protein